jgi:hypothetical protein
MKYTNKIKDTLKLGDIVIFNIKGVKYEYKVEFCYLHYLVGFSNDIIFTKLNLNKFNFCTKHYGYYEYNEYNEYIERYKFWPECKPNDFEALTRVVNALYDKINKSILPDNLFTLE